jgi:hypothetical protein
MKADKIIITSTIFLLFGTIACNKEQNQDEDVSQSTVEVETNMYSNELEKNADAVTFNKNNDGYGSFDGNSDCVEISVTYPEGGTFPKVITVDYGEENCEIRPNLFKRGQIIITVSDSIVNLGAQRTITFVGFYINDHEVTGMKTLANLGGNSDGFLVYDINNSLSIGEWSRQATGTKTWIEGADTDAFLDNVFLLDGTSSTSRPNEIIINRTITSSLRIDRSCNYITEGIVSIQWNGNNATIDYGDGSCDDIAIISRNGQEFEIDLDNFRCRRIH